MAHEFPSGLDLQQAAADGQAIIASLPTTWSARRACAALVVAQTLVEAAADLKRQSDESRRSM